MRPLLPLLVVACTADPSLDDLTQGLSWDETPPPAPGFVLDGGPAAPGRFVDITATLPVPPAPPDDVPVYFLQSNAGLGQGLCAPILGGDCLGIQSPFTIHGPVRTTGGEATLPFFVSPGHPGLQFQALVVTPSGAFLSTPLDVPFQSGPVDTAPQVTELPLCPTGAPDCVDPTGLALWLRAEDVAPGLVGTWPDASPAGTDAVQLLRTQQPARVSLPTGDVVAFDGVDDRLDLLGTPFDAGTRPWTVLAVLNALDDEGHLLGTGPSVGGLAADGHGLALVDGRVALKAGDGEPPVRGTSRIDDGELRLVSAVASDGISAVYVDGALEDFSSADLRPVARPGATLGASDGAVTGASAHPARVGVAELLYFERQLSADERQQLEGALAERHGLTVATSGDPTCVPDTCEAGGFACGTHADGCGGTVQCGTFCPLELVPSTAAEDSGTFPASLVTDRWAYWNDDPEAHVVARFPTADLSAVDHVAVRMDGPEGSETITADPMRKFELLVALSDHPPGDYRITAELVGTTGDVVASEHRDVTRVDRARVVRRTAVDIPLRLNPMAPGTTWPVTTAIPLPLGLLDDVGALGLYRDGVPVPGAFTERSRWGAADTSSLRWVSLSFLADDAGSFHVGPAHGVVGDLDVVDQPTYVVVDTGRVRFRVSKVAFAGLEDLWHDADGNGSYDAGEQVMAEGVGPYAIDADGVVYESRFAQDVSVEVVERSPTRAVIVATGSYVDPMTGASRTTFHTQLTATAGDPRVHVSHRTTLTHDTRTEVPLQDLGWSMSLQGAGDVRVGIDGAPVDLTAPADGSVFLHQESHESVRVATDVGSLEQPVTSGQRADGWMAFDRPDTSLVLTLRHPWQLYPKELEITGGADPTLDLHFWPEHATSPWSDGGLARDEVWNLRWAHQGDALSLATPLDLLEAMQCYRGFGCTNDLALCDPLDRNCLSACTAVACGTDAPTCQPTCDPADTDCVVCVDPPACDPCKAVMGASYTEQPDAGWGGSEADLQLLQLSGSNEVGVTVGNTFVLSFADDVVTEAATVQDDPHAIPDPAWTADSDVEGRFAPKDAARWPEVEATIADLFPSIERVVHAQNGSYGMFRWPDFNNAWHPERNVPDLHRASQGAHYQTGLAPFLYYLRSGDTQHLQFARTMSAMFTHVYTNAAVNCSRHAKAFVPWESNCQGDGHWTNPDQYLYRWLLFDDHFAHDRYLGTYEVIRRGDRYASWGPETIVGSGRELNATLGDMLNYYRLTHDPDMLFLVDRWADQTPDIRPWGTWNTGMMHWHRKWMLRYQSLTRDPRLLPQVRSWLGTGVPTLTPAVLAWREPEVQGVPDHAYLRTATSTLYDYVSSRFDAPGDPLHGYGVWMSNPATAQTVELPYVLGALLDAEQFPGAPTMADAVTALSGASAYPTRDLNPVGIRLLGHPVILNQSAIAVSVDVVATQADAGPVQVSLTKTHKDFSTDYLRFVAPDGGYASRNHRASARGDTWSPTLPGAPGMHRFDCRGGVETCAFGAPWSDLPEATVWRQRDASGDVPVYASTEPYRLHVRGADPAAPITLRFRPVLDKHGHVELEDALAERSIFPGNVRVEHPDGTVEADVSLFVFAADPARHEQTLTLTPPPGAGPDHHWVVTVTGSQGAAVELPEVPGSAPTVYASTDADDLHTVLDAVTDACELPTADCPTIQPGATCGWVTDACGHAVACEPAAGLCPDDGYCAADHTCATSSDFGLLAGRVRDLSTYADNGQTHVWVVAERHQGDSRRPFAGAPNVAHWDGQTLHVRDDETVFSTAMGVSAVAPDQVWVVGRLAGTDEPVLSRWDGSAWQHACVGAPLADHLWTVWADPTRPASDPEVWMARRNRADDLFTAATGAPTVYRYEGGVCTAIDVVSPDPGVTLGVRRVFGTGSGDVYVVGERFGTVNPAVTDVDWVALARFDGTTWTAPFPTGSVANGSQLNAVAGRVGPAGDEIVAAGHWTEPGPSFLRHDGTIRTQDAGEMDVWDVWMAATGETWAVGNELVASDDGIGWQRHEIPLAPSLLLTAVDGTGADDVWLAGSQLFFRPQENGTRHRGVVLHWDGTTLSVR